MSTESRSPTAQSALISEHLRRAYAHLTGLAYTDNGVLFHRSGYTLYADVEYQPQHPENPLFRVVKDRNNIILRRVRLDSDCTWPELARMAVETFTVY